MYIRYIHMVIYVCTSFERQSPDYFTRITGNWHMFLLTKSLVSYCHTVDVSEVQGCCTNCSRYPMMCKVISVCLTNLYIDVYMQCTSTGSGFPPHVMLLLQRRHVGDMFFCDFSSGIEATESLLSGARWGFETSSRVRGSRFIMGYLCTIRMNQLQYISIIYQSSR